jgi:hypothetical protein
VTYGENHYVLHTEQLQKGDQVDPPRTTGESDRVRVTTEEVGLTGTIVLMSGTGFTGFICAPVVELEPANNRRRNYQTIEFGASGQSDAPGSFGTGFFI